jgi:hypothetical protein
MAISSINTVTNIQSAMAAAMQEAGETTATTKIEAAHGDQQAIRKLAKQQQQQELMQPNTPKQGIDYQG